MLFRSQKGKKVEAAGPAIAGKAATAVSAQVNGAAAPAAASAQPAPAVALPTAEAKRRADYSHRVMQAFGAIVAIYMRSKPHREMRLCDIEGLVGPAVTTGQFSLAEATHKQNGLVTPVAVVLWASVSGAVDARISADPEKPPALSPPEWKSGDTIWIVEAIGDQRMIGPMLQRLQTTLWKGRTVKMRHKGDDGRVLTHVLMEKTSV